MVRPLPETPADALGDLVRDRVIIGYQSFWIEKPAASNDLLDHPAIHSAFASDEYLPYWADLWPASRMLAKIIMAEPWVPGLRALELGCGLGLPGIVALSRGLHVTFSDYDLMAVRFAGRNARLNGFAQFTELRFDWRAPPDDLQFDVIFASDLTYEARNIEPLVALLKRALAPGGLCLWTDEDRPPAKLLREELDRLGWPYTTQIVRASDPGGDRHRGTLYRIQRPTSGDARG
jgi:predicted nicotinamide N-methyase